MALSRDGYLILGALLGIATVYITPVSVDMKNDKKKDAGTNTTSNQSYDNIEITSRQKDGKFYGDSTMSGILHSARKGFKKLWNSWIIIVPNEDDSIYQTARTSFRDSSTNTSPSDIDNPTNLADITPYDATTSANTSTSTIYRGVPSTDPSNRSSKTGAFREAVSEIIKGFKRSGTSRNDSICRNFPRQSTFIEPRPMNNERTVRVGDETMEELENIARNPKEDTKESRKSNKVIVRVKKSFSPVLRLEQRLRDFLRFKKKVHENNDHSIMEANGNS